MVECLSQGKKQLAAGLLNELLDAKTADPIQMLALFSMQYKRLYAVQLAREAKKGPDWLISSEILRKDQKQDQTWLAKKLFNMRISYSPEQLEKIICLLAEADYGMKTGRGDTIEHLKDVFIRLVSEVANAENR